MFNCGADCQSGWQPAWRVRGVRYACAFRMNRTPNPASNSASPAKPQVESAGAPGVVACVTVELVVEVLFPVTGSGVVETTVAVLESGPDEFGLATTITTVAEPPLAMVPREQLTVLVPEQDPCDGVAETNVEPAGKTSFTVTPAAELGPAFATAMRSEERRVG